MFGTATIIVNRIKGCDFRKVIDVKRGDSDEIVSSDRKVGLIKWKDNKMITFTA